MCMIKAQACSYNEIHYLVQAKSFTGHRLYRQDCSMHFWTFFFFFFYRQSLWLISADVFFVVSGFLFCFNFIVEIETHFAQTLGLENAEVFFQVWNTVEDRRTMQHVIRTNIGRFVCSERDSSVETPVDLADDLDCISRSGPTHVT